MPTKIGLGKIGEDLAARYLVSRGYTILERNWRQGHWEIDLICKKEDLLIFVEVKARTGKAFGNPEEAVHPQKQENLRKASLSYIHKIRHPGEIRFDILSIILGSKNEALEILHLEDAFFPGL